MNSLRSWFDNPVFQRYAWLQFKRGRSPLAMLWPAAFTALLFGAPLMVPDSWFSLRSGDFYLRAKWSFGLLLAYVGVCTLLSAPSTVSMAVANDRATGLLHAIRLTPQSAATKVLGYCIGPALRPYTTALLALPFMLFAALLGATTIPGFVQIVVVLVTTSLLANLLSLHIALAARMPEPGEAPAGPLASALGIMRRQVRPQDVGVQGAMAPFGWCIIAMMAYQAGHPAVGAVTPIPTLAGSFFVDPNSTSRWGQVSLIGLAVPVSVLTVLVQVTLAAFFFRAASRVIQDDGARGLRRIEIFLMFALLAALEVMTVWDSVGGGPPGPGVVPWRAGRGSPESVLYGYLCVVGALSLLYLRSTSTNLVSLRRAWRRAKAGGRATLEPFGEGQHSLVSLLILGGLSTLGYLLLLGAAWWKGGVEVAGLPQAAAAPTLLLLMMLVVGGVSQLAQLSPATGGWMSGAMILLWGIAPFAGLCLRTAGYSGPGVDELLSLFPLTALSQSVEWALGVARRTSPHVIWGVFQGPLIPVLVNAALAGIVASRVLSLWRRQSEAARLPPEDPKAPSPSVPLASPAPAG